MRGLMQDVPLTLQLVLERAAALFPHKRITTTLEGGFHVETYRELVERVHRLASALQALGVRPGDRVATFAWNSWRHVELYLAIPCMGAVLHTLNPRLHHDQVTYIANHAQDRVLFADTSWAPAWELVGDVPSLRDVVWMDDVGEGVPGDGFEYEALVAGADPRFTWPRLDEHQAASMCYTSGTTGDPKGVVYAHRSATLHSMASLFVDSNALAERDVCLPVVPQFHANAWGTVYAALLAGSDLAMAARFTDPRSLAALVAQAGVTVSAAVPTVWFALLQALRTGEVDRASLRSLERILCGGSAVPEALMRAFDELGIRMVHAWGMTETSPLASVATAPSTAPPDEVRRIRLTQGFPLPTLKVRVVGDDGTVAPWDGASMGELQISGPWIADAYYDPTEPDGRGGEDRFATDDDGTRWLRTGDVAVILPSGAIQLTDRTKDLVKSGGEWISSVELENVLVAHPAVREAAVIAVPHPKWDERPLACVVADGEVTKDDLLAHVARHVARWQVPDDVVFLDEVPKTSVGKFDKKVLRERFADYRLGDG